MNIFPARHILLGGDVIQAINMTENFVRFHYDAFGSASLFYGVFYIIDQLGISDTAQLSWYVGIFLLGSFFSFLSFCALVFSRSSGLTRSLSALFYATNLYTLYVFTAAWGYSSYQVLYIFIPLLVGMYIKALESSQRIFSYGFVGVAFLASTSFGNPAFALSLGILFFFLTLALFLFRSIPFDRQTLLKIGMLVFGAALMNTYWLLPQIPQLRGGVQAVYTSEFVDLSERLRETSNAFSDTIRLLPTSEQERYYPMNFPYPDFSQAKRVIAFIAFIPFFLALYGFFRKRSSRDQKIFGAFFMLTFIFMALVARVRFPFESMNEFLFTLPGFNTLRGWDKLATITPFLLSGLLLLFLQSFEGKKYARFLMLSFLLMTIILALPFYVGGLQTKLSFALSGQKAKDYTKAKYSALVEVPQAYYDVASVIESSKKDSKIAMLPYAPGSSVGRVNFPTWKVNGPDIAYRLYSKKYVELYDYYIPHWMFATEFESQHDPQWITDLYGLLGVEYVFFHKDTRKENQEEFEGAKEYLERTGALQKVKENDFFTLYTLEEKRVFPYVFVGINAPFVPMKIEGLSQSVQALRENIEELAYQRKNPREIMVPVVDMKQDATIFLNERYDSLWRAEYVDLAGNKVSLTRDNSIQHANAWRLDRDRKGGNVSLYYLPARLLYVGMWITGVSLFVLSILLASEWRKRWQYKSNR
ncbi:MAG: hypothetical protein HYV45_03890 [Candidatus Moranbacteria bacterium]|nr:hypothetical protein [Candidatus Moranbacteria bacterium]